MDPSGVMPEWKSLLESGHSMGSDDAPVTIVAFSDFQCPACRHLSTVVRALRVRYPDKIRYVHRHFPLPNRPHAAAAAHASECAAMQGVFAPFHDRLFSEQEVIGRMPWKYFAELAGVPDLQRFSNCVENEHSSRIAKDRAKGLELGIDRTPTIVMNGRRINGAPTFAVLEELVVQELQNPSSQTF